MTRLKLVAGPKKQVAQAAALPRINDLGHSDLPDAENAAQ